MKLLFVSMPKCGSTSVVELMLRLSGTWRDGEKPRKQEKESLTREKMEAAGFFVREVSQENLAEFVANYEDYRIIANIRDPYRRILSNYYSKLNRYTKRFDKPVYCYGKIRQILGGPSSWPHIEVAVKHMQKYISFEKFVDGLGKNGINFDTHYRAQSQLLQIATIKYDILFRLETLSDDLSTGLKRLGVEQTLLDKIGHIPHRNITQYEDDLCRFLVPEVKKKIYALYEPDFEQLGYEP